MANVYAFQLRRGWKDDQRDDWAAYEAQENHIKPLEGELVLEYDHGIPRLKIGNGTDEFSALPYMSIDSFILPKPISITLYANKWQKTTDDGWYQVVTVDNAVITPYSKVDLQPNADQLCDFYDLGINLTTENDDGIITVYLVGDAPAKSYTIQATVSEVVIDG